MRLVITGMGAVTPVGIGVPAYFQGLLDGRCGIGPITRLPAEKLPVHAAAEVVGFDPKAFLPHRLVLELDTFMQYAYVSAEEALRQSGLDPAGGRTGIIMGSALSGLALTGATQEALTVSGTPVGPRFLSKVMGNIAAAQFSIFHHITGPSMTVSTACSSGGDAVTLAALLLRAGAADAIVVMAGESVLSPLFFDSLHKAGALSRTGRSLPFSRLRDGFVAGEGGGALILETEQSALRRGAAVLAELPAGCANNTDGFHVVSPEPEGRGAAACMALSLKDAGLTAAQISYVNAHGTATPRGDRSEALALHQIFGDYAVPVSSTKGATGHMMGAGGITELIACVKAIETGLLPPNLGGEPDPECGLNLVAEASAARPVSYCMSNALGFGGQNSSLIVGRYRRD